MLVVLSGGTGTPKLLDGLVELLPPQELCVIANTADDFYFYGLRVCPDLDSVLYILADRLDTTKWWGVTNDSYHVRDAMHELHENIWFNLGDIDLALSLLRTNLLKQNRTLSEVTGILRTRLDIKSLVYPMTDELVQTFISTPTGRIHLQEWLIKHRSQPTVLDIEFEGINEANPPKRVIEHIQNADAIIIGPSNPVTSIGPILAISEIRETLEAIDTPVLVISPFIDTKPISGPAGIFLQSKNLPVHSKSLITLYKEFMDILIVDPMDIETLSNISESIQLVGLNSLMNTRQDRITLAREVLRLLHERSLVGR